MTNIVMLNFAYDVPVKIYSSQLLIEAIVIALPDIPRVVNFFIRNRAITPAPLPRLTHSRALEITGIVPRTLAVVAFLVMSVVVVRDNLRLYGGQRNRSPLYGIWRVDDYQIDGHAVAGLARWRRVIFEIRPMMSVQLMDDVRVRLSAKMDEKNRSLAVSRRNEPQWDGRLTYQRSTPGTLTIDGNLGGKNVHALCHLEPMPKFLLTTRGFRWINEFPFNR